MTQNISILHFKNLSLNDFHDLIKLRLAVFVVEQDCPYQDIDGLDKDAYHLILKDLGQIIGTLRILKAGVVYPEVAIGRVATHQDYRGKALGHLMIKNAMEFVKSELKASAIRLSAQTHLVNFYEKHGFSSTGKEYLEDGIPHTEMICHF